MIWEVFPSLNDTVILWKSWLGKADHNLFWSESNFGKEWKIKDVDSMASGDTLGKMTRWKEVWIKCVQYAQMLAGWPTSWRDWSCMWSQSNAVGMTEESSNSFSSPKNTTWIAQQCCCCRCKPAHWHAVLVCFRELRVTRWGGWRKSDLCSWYVSVCQWHIYWWCSLTDGTGGLTWRAYVH